MLGTIFKDGDGNTSSLRLVWTLAVLTTFGVWAYICITTGVFIPFTTGDAMMIGLLFGGKAGQKFVETKKVS